jgi:hypothetical protein
MKLAIENVTRATETTATTEMASTELLLALDRAAWQAEEDAAIDAETILEQAEEANALDPVG